MDNWSCRRLIYEITNYKSICITSAGKCNTGRPLGRFFTRLSAGRVSQVRSQTSRLWLLKCWLTGAEIAKIDIFGYKFSLKWYIPLSDFYKIWREGATPRLAPSCQI